MVKKDIYTLNCVEHIAIDTAEGFMETTSSDWDKAEPLSLAWFYPWSILLWFKIRLVASGWEEL